MRRFLPLALVFLLIGCGGSDDDAAQGGVGADDAKRLDAAAAKLDAEMQPAETEASGPERAPQQPAPAKK